MGTIFLDEIRSGLGVRSLADLRDSEPAAHWFDVTANAYARLSATAPAPPPRGTNEIRPVIATSSVSPHDEAEIAARSLLLAPSVAILLSDSINYARRLLRLATLLESAIDAGIVVLLPESSVADFGYFDAALVSAYADLPADEADRAARASSATSRLEVALAMDAAARFPNRLDLAAATAGQVADIRDLIEQTFGVRRPQTDRFRFLPDLLELRIPRLALRTEELVALRRDGLFEDLRAGLAEALRRTERLSDEQIVDPGSVRVRDIREYLSEVTAESVRGATRSRVVRGATVGGVGIGVGAVSGALGSLGGPETAAVVGAGSSVASMVITWLGGRPHAGTRRFRERVVRLFGEDD